MRGSHGWVLRPSRVAGATVPEPIRPAPVPELVGQGFHSLPPSAPKRFAISMALSRGPGDILESEFVDGHPQDVRSTRPMRPTFQLGKALNQVVDRLAVGLNTLHRSFDELPVSTIRSQNFASLGDYTCRSTLIIRSRHQFGQYVAIVSQMVVECGQSSFC